MTKEQCGRCNYLSWMNTKNSPKDCCRYFYPPQALENVKCKQTRVWNKMLIEPSLTKGHDNEC